MSAPQGEARIRSINIALLLKLGRIPDSMTQQVIDAVFGGAPCAVQQAGPQHEVVQPCGPHANVAELMPPANRLDDRQQDTEGEGQAATERERHAGVE